MIKKKVILYKTEWCGHCKTIKPEWAKFKAAYDTFKEDIKGKYDIELDIIELDGDKHKEAVESAKVTGFPTIMIEYNGKKEEYSGDRTALALFRKVIPNLKDEDVANWALVCEQLSNAAGVKKLK